ncbi:hypothetical protein ERN12_04195 [Rhodobacteraceae bacterium]|nr:hypothetical protein ERN12_04195 [Paracoccaceae bacterium]
MTNIYIRMIIYSAPPLLTALVALVPGWGVHSAEAVLLIDIVVLAGAVVAPSGCRGPTPQYGV